MGQKFVPELHDPDYMRMEGQDTDRLSEEEIDARFEALVAELDQEAGTARRTDEACPSESAWLDLHWPRLRIGATHGSRLGCDRSGSD